MRTPIRTLLLAAATCIAAIAGAQSAADAHTRLADRLYERMAYAPAIKEYRLAADMGALNEHVTKRLASAYMKLDDTEHAEQWYAQVVRFLNREPIDLFNYAQALKGNGKYAEAEVWMDRYLAATQPEGVPRKSNIEDFAKKFNSTMDRFTVRAVSINTSWTDMAATWNGTQQVIFSSSRDARVGIQRRAAWNDEPFLDLYRATRQPNGDLIDAQRLEGGVNSKLHDGPAVCDASGSNMWFTRSNASRSKNGVHRLSILRTHRDGRGWSGAVQPFLYNNPECSVGHPALSPDGHTLYFVSDMPGGFGGTDIYMCKDLGGQWGEPENLGALVNTPQNELFPFVAADGTLYFASNGQPGLGGLDIFAAQHGAGGTITAVVNVGAPVNGPKDDFAFIIDAEGRTGYFTSDRPGGAGGDDIYAFEMHAPLEQRFLCTGVVVDDADETPLMDAEVQLLDKAGNVVGTARSDRDGKYAFSVQKDMEYTVRARAQGRFDGEAHLSTERIEQQQIVARDVHLVPDAGIWLRGAVRYKDRLGFVEGVSVSLVNMSSFYSEQRTTDQGGDFIFRLQPNEQFEVLFEKRGYYSISIPVNTAGMKQGVIELGRTHELDFEEILVGTPILLKHIRWDAGSDKLDSVAKAELDALADRLQVNPALIVEIGVHSDARGDAAAEQKLSQKRADAAVAYLRSKGVPKEHVLAKGYGATRLLNQCGPGVACTEQEHAENRRVEYTVIGPGKE
ncbi:MAG: carboxypeptidase regulatory-like domain-containing protein [Flavobacteriales bacterium]